MICDGPDLIKVGQLSMRSQVVMIVEAVNVPWTLRRAMNLSHNLVRDFCLRQQQKVRVLKLL